MNTNLNTHTCYERDDPDAPDLIKDRNGDITLGLCKHCGRGECELTEPCDTVTSPHAELIALLKESRPNYGDVGTRDVDVAAQCHKIDQAIRMLVRLPAPSASVQYAKSEDAPYAPLSVPHDEFRASQPPSAEYVDGVVGDLLEGIGAPEDHEAALAAFQYAGLSKDTAYRTLRAIACAEVMPNWHECQRIADLPAVHEMLFDFSQDPTGDNGVMVVRAVLEATRKGEK
ncbi:hypothetical protein [Cupriavidus necator]